MTNVMPIACDLLLILPRDDGKDTRETGWWQQVGHGILATEALRSGLSVKILDASTYDSDSDFQADLRNNYRPTVAGITPSITSGKSTESTLRTLRETGVKAVIAGGHMVSRHRTLLNFCREYGELVDAVCVGDGRGIFTTNIEAIIARISNGYKNLVSTRNICDVGLDQDSWRAMIDESFERPPEIGHPILYSRVFDLPRYWRKYATNYLAEIAKQAEPSKYKKPVAIQTMQGCPFRRTSPCVFCGRMELNSRYLDKTLVLEELSNIMSCGGDSVIIVEDSGLLASRSAQALADEWPDDLGVVFMYARVNLIDGKRAGILKKVNCDRVFIGIESGDEESLKALNKNYSPKQAYEACAVLKEHDIKVSPSFIIGAPPAKSFGGETTSTVENTMRLVERLHSLGNLDLCFVNILTPYDGNAAFELLLDRLPDDDRSRIERSVFVDPQELQQLWCEHVLPISYDQANALKEKLIGVFGDKYLPEYGSGGDDGT